MNKIIIMLLLIATMLLASCSTQTAIIGDDTGKAAVGVEKEAALVINDADIIAQTTMSDRHRVIASFDLSNLYRAGGSYYINSIIYEDVYHEGESFVLRCNSPSQEAHIIGDDYTTTCTFDITSNFDDTTYCGKTLYPTYAHFICSGFYQTGTCMVEGSPQSWSDTIYWECPGTPCETHYSKKCYNGDVYYYDSCGVKEDRFDDCSSSETCTNGQCVSQGCVTGEKRCYNTGSFPESYQICTSGSWGTAIDCSSTQVCSNGQCVPSTTPCTPYAKECNQQVSTQYRECSSSGQWSSYQACPSGQTCSGAGLCAGESCETVSEKKCVSQTIVATCDSNHNWIEQGCPSNTICNAGNCIPNNGTTQCKAYEELKDSECKFSIMKAFTGSGFTQLREDKPEIVYGSIAIVVLAIIALIMYFKYKKSSDVFY